MSFIAYSIAIALLSTEDITAGLLPWAVALSLYNGT